MFDAVVLLVWVAGAVLLLAVVLNLVRLVRATWAPTPQARRALRTEGSKKDRRRRVAAFVFSTLAVIVYLLYYEHLFRGIAVSSSTLASLFADFRVPDTLLAWIIVGATPVLVVVIPRIRKRWPALVGSLLWVASLLALVSGAVITTAHLFQLSPWLVAGLIVLAVAIPAYRIVFEGLRYAWFAVRMTFKRAFDVVKAFLLRLPYWAREFRVALSKLPERIRAAADNLDARIEATGQAPILKRTEELLDEANRKETVGDETFVSRPRKSRKNTDQEKNET